MCAVWKKTVSLFFCILCLSMITFGDVVNEKPSPWAEVEMAMAQKLGLIQSKDSIAYKENITRKLFCTYIVRGYEQLTTEMLPFAVQMPFTDVNDEAVSKAYAKGMIYGKSPTTFMPDAPISREEMMVIMDRVIELLAKDLDYTFDVESSESLKPFKDQSQISSWARSASNRMISYGLLSGSGNQTLSPKGNCTTEQAIAILLRLITFVESSKHAYTLDQNQYIQNGQWWSFDEAYSLTREPLFRHVAQGYKGICLTKDGSLYFNPALWYGADQKGVAKKLNLYGVDLVTKWQKVQIKGVIAIIPQIQKEGITCLHVDGSVSFLKASTLKTTPISYNEQIQSIAGSGQVTVALSKSGKLYLEHKGIITRLDVDTPMQKVSVRDLKLRSLDNEGKVWEWGVILNKDGNVSVDAGKINADLIEMTLDYYGDVNSSLQAYIKAKKILQIDDSSGNTVILKADGNLSYKYTYGWGLVDLDFRARSFGNNLYLSEDGSLSLVYQLGGVVGYSFSPLIPVSGLTKVSSVFKGGILQEDGILYRVDEEILFASAGVGSPSGKKNIWDAYSDHKNMAVSKFAYVAGTLADSIPTSEVKKIVVHEEQGFILTTKGQVWHIPMPLAPSVLGDRSTAKPVLIFDHIEDIGEGYFISDKGDLFYVESKTAYKKLYPIAMTKLAGFVHNSGTYALSAEGVLINLGNVKQFTEKQQFTDLYSVDTPFVYNGLPKFVEAWACNPLYQPLGDQFGIGLDAEGKKHFIGSTVQYEKGIRTPKSLTIDIPESDAIWATPYGMMMHMPQGMNQSWLLYVAFYFPNDPIEWDFADAIDSYLIMTKK